MTNIKHSRARTIHAAGVSVTPVPLCKQIAQTGEFGGNDGRIHVPIMHTVILAMIAWIASQFLVGCSEDRSRSNDDMKQRAEAAIRVAGGVDALGNEAKIILSKFRVGSDWKTTSSNGSNCPVITKMHSLLSPDGHYPWVVTDQGSLPAHVVIRFDSHAHYEYVWIFDPAPVPLGKFEGVEHLGGAVYLSKKNQ